ncbi:MAG: hypothetical protein K2W96_19915, partial [Gemmataceae bacterium]|nr:hypothetical protein [Gemmataceae bacterium]
MRMTEEEEALCDGLGLLAMRTGEGMRERLSVRPHHLRHMLEDHADHPHEATFGDDLAGRLRHLHRVQPHADPHPLGEEVRGVLAEQLADSFRRGQAMLYSVAGRQWLKAVAVLRSGAMVPVCIGGGRAEFLSHYFRPNSRRDTDEGRREAAARYLVDYHCPRCGRTGRPAYPAPWHDKPSCPPQRGGETPY